MTRTYWSTMPLVALLVAAAPVLRQPAAAQTPRTLDIGGPPRDTVLRRCATDSLVTAALAAFNSPAAVHFPGGGSSPAAITIGGDVAVYRGNFAVNGTIQGNVVALNANVRVFRTGVIRGSITVLGGGTLTIDPGAQIGGKQLHCDEVLAFAKMSDGRVALSAPGSPFGSIGSLFTWQLGNYRITPHVGVGGYNRVEELPIHVGANLSRRWGLTDRVHGEAYAILRTARDPSGSRPTIGWYASALYAHSGDLPFTITLGGGTRLQATRDQPFAETESGASAFLLRRDYNDWYEDRGTSLAVAFHPANELTLSGTYAVSHQTTVLAVDAFSLLRSTVPWRPNPLIDDGRYQIMTGQVIWDARDEQQHPTLTWYVRAQWQHVSSSDLTPVSLPTTIRDALPTTGYGSTTADIDLRAYLRLDPQQRLDARIVAGGYVSGDPLTIQARRAMGGADPMLGYDFRAINCDRQRKVFTSTPALCDRTMAVQVAYHRALPIDLSTQIGGRTIGLRNPELVVLGDIGSAWLAGDTPGRVPSNRIQALREWRSDIGVGITNGPFGLYLSKALADALPVQLTLLFHPRF